MHSTRLRIAGTAIALVVAMLLSGSAAAQNFLIGSWQIRDGTILAVPIIGVTPGETLVFHPGGIRGSRVTSESRDPVWYEIVGDYTVRSPDSVTFAGIGIGPLPVQFNCRLIAATTAECGAAIGAMTIVRSPLTMEQLRDLETRRRAEIEAVQTQRAREEAQRAAEAERRRVEDAERAAAARSQPGASQSPRSGPVIDQEMRGLQRGPGRPDSRPPPSAMDRSGSSSRSDPGNPGLPVSRGEQDAIREHINRFWNRPTTARGSVGPVVDLRIRCAPDGTVRDVRVEDRDRYAREPAFRSAADSAIRAVRLASPLPLPIGRVEQYADFILTFDPRR